jgi:hypothetical protein
VDGAAELIRLTRMEPTMYANPIRAVTLAVGLSAAALAASACGGGLSHSAAASPPVSATYSPSAQSSVTTDAQAAAIENAVMQAMGGDKGCWDPTPSEGIGAAYQQVFYSLGEQLATPADVAVGDTGCSEVLNADGAEAMLVRANVLDLQWFNTPAEAADAGRAILDAGTASGDQAAYVKGDLLLIVADSAPPALTTFLASSAAA